MQMSGWKIIFTSLFSKREIKGISTRVQGERISFNNFSHFYKDVHVLHTKLVAYTGKFAERGFQGVTSGSLLRGSGGIAAPWTLGNFQTFSIFNYFFHFSEIFINFRRKNQKYLSWLTQMSINSCLCFFTQNTYVI